MDQKVCQFDILPSEIVLIILQYTCLYISSQVCKSWNELCFVNGKNYGHKPYIVSRHIYNYYRYNRFANINEIICDSMLENTEESRKLLWLIKIIDKRDIDKICYNKFWQKASDFSILYKMDTYLDWHVSSNINNLSSCNISFESLKYLEDRLSSDCTTFTFNLNNEKSIKYLEDKGYQKRILGDKVKMRLRLTII